MKRLVYNVLVVNLVENFDGYSEYLLSTTITVSNLSWVYRKTVIIERVLFYLI